MALGRYLKDLDYFRLKMGDCLVVVVRTENDRSLEEEMDRNGCKVYSFHVDNSSTGINDTERIVFHPLDEVGLGKQVQEIVGRHSVIDYLLVRAVDGQLYEFHVLDQLVRHQVINRIKQMSIGINLCPLGSDKEPPDGRFNEDHFQGVLAASRYLTETGWALIDVVNDDETFDYNPILEMNTFCASQMALLNRRFIQTHTTSSTTIVA